MKGFVACPRYTILQYEVEGSTELSEADLVLIYEAKVSGLNRKDGVNLHVGGLCKAGRFLYHKPPWEGAELI